MKILILSVVTLLLVACKSSQDHVRVATDYIARPVVYQKPGASVSLRDSQVNLDVSGVQYAVDVDIGSAYSDGKLLLDVHASDGLHIVGGDTELVMTLSQEIITLPYVLIAERDGRYYLYLNATVERDGQKRSRALTLIVQVGEEEAAIKNEEPGSLEKSTNEELMIVLPVKEEIIR